MGMVQSGGQGWADRQNKSLADVKAKRGEWQSQRSAAASGLQLSFKLC